MKRLLPSILIIINIFIQQIIAQTKLDSVISLRQRGIQLYVQGDYRGAALTFKTCLSDSTKDTLANYYSGLCAYQLGDYPLAQANFSITIHNDSLSKSSYFQRGRVHASMGLFPAAINDYENAICRDSTFRPARIELLKTLCLLQRYDTAVALADTNSIDELVTVGRGLVAAMKHQAAVLIAHRATKLDYNSYAAQMLLGDTYFGMDDFKDALGVYAGLLYYYKDAVSAVRKLAICFSQRKTKEDYSIAIRFMQKYFDLSSDYNASDLGRIGSWFYARNEYDSALAYFDHAVRLDSLNPVPHYNLGSTLLKKDSLDAARNELNTAYILSKSSLDLSASVLTSLGGIYYKQRSLFSAINAYKQAIDLSSANAQAMYGLALCYDLSPGWQENALQWYNKISAEYIRE
ncbi:MAG: tetratricopeptide repeat protein [Ignavibacteriales bacterium]|nr:tetratricopeptide repeat protein [Ignavibacteriales bacterium]